MTKIQIITAYNHLEQIKQLFTAYTKSLDINLDFQNYSQELKNLPGQYNIPQGILYIALVDNKPAGCIALRKIGQNDCEMKRLYVDPNFRGLGLGKLLSQKLLKYAKKQGYNYMYLDTLDTLLPAVQLYRKLGFVATNAYYETPLENTLFFKYDLQKL